MLEDINKMKVADLKKELKNRGLSTVGNKTELQERLQAALIDSDLGDSVLEDSVNSGISDEMLDEEGLIDDDEDLDDDEAEAILQSGDEALLKSPTSVKEVKLPTPPLPPKKVTLKRNISAIIMSSDDPKPDESSKKIKITSEIVSKITSNESTKSISSNSGDESNPDEDKKIVKLKILTAAERLELRAKKFGAAIPVNADVKKQARAERFGLEEKKDNKITNNVAAPSAEILKKRAERFGVTVSSTMVKIENQEKLLKRQQRFGKTSDEKSSPAITKSGEAATVTDLDEKARLRLERFKTGVK